MVTPGKGILAADESSGTIKKRFDAIEVESTEESRRDYREMLFRSTEAMSKYISGVILYDETIWQTARDGTPLVKLIEQSGALPGIKVDEGTQALPNCPGELVTSGLDKLAERLKKYYERGARFAKWRAVIDIGSELPVASGDLLDRHVLGHGVRLEFLREAGDQRVELGAALLALDGHVECGAREDAMAQRIEARRPPCPWACADRWSVAHWRD